jgi:ComF family protein
MGSRGEDSGHRSVGAGLRLSAASAANAAMALIMAPACAACASVLEEPLAGPVCPACWASVLSSPISWLPPHRSSIERVISAGAYDGILRDIIHAWKFERRQSLARPLARLVREHCAEALRDADLVVPVPMTPWRRWQRGFNQADDLARHLGVPRARLLARLRPRPAQSTLPSARRQTNLDASIFVPIYRRAAARARVIVLVDDVVTTGATLEACAMALRRAGAKQVRAVTVAHTPLRGGAALKGSRSVRAA